MSTRAFIVPRHFRYFPARSHTPPPPPLQMHICAKLTQVCLRLAHVAVWTKESLSHRPTNKQKIRAFHAFFVFCFICLIVVLPVLFHRCHFRFSSKNVWMHGASTDRQQHTMADSYIMRANPREMRSTKMKMIKIYVSNYTKVCVGILPWPECHYKNGRPAHVRSNRNRIKVECVFRNGLCVPARSTAEAITRKINSISSCYDRISMWEIFKFTQVKVDFEWALEHLRFKSTLSYFF